LIKTKIIVENLPENKIIPQLFYDALDFYLKKLKIDKGLNILIRFEKLIKCTGDCREIDTNKNKPSKKFQIRLCPKKSKILILKSLAHELVHVQQYSSGRKQKVSYDHVFFDDIEYKNVDLKDPEFYYFSPWEIEANGKEVALYSLFIKGLK
jgi:hypothetical protein